MTTKNRLTLFLAAGSSISECAPSTSDLTRLVRSADVTLNFGTILRGLWTPDEKVRIPALLNQALRGVYANPNFEHFIAALEDIQSLTIAHYDADLDDEFVHPLSPFVRLDPIYQNLRFPMVANYTRTQLLKLISDCIRVRLANHDGEPHTKLLVEKLRAASFSIAAFALNYDDLLDRAEGWSDGFTLKEDATVPYYSFDRVSFLKAQENEGDLLVHLHGSIKFGFRNQLQADAELVKYETAEEAYNTLGYQTGDTYDNGSVVSAAPMISGFHKVVKVNHSPAPYGYYYKALTDSLLTCPRLMIIGYGMNDYYVNNWLREFLAVRGDQRRVVMVCRDNVPNPDFVRALAGDIDLAQAGSVIKGKFLMLCKSGFPLPEDALQTAFSFLAP